MTVYVRFNSNISSDSFDSTNCDSSNNFFPKQNSTMSLNEKHRAVSRQPTLPPLSNRTLHHPSFSPLYMNSGFEQCYRQGYNRTVHPIITPAELFYTDPTMSCGRRIPNLVSELEVLDCFQLNTPPPLMSVCQAPPVRPDPFRSGPHPTTDLGRLTLKINGLQPSAQPNLLVLQLTQEEDDTITSLLKLHHQEPLLPNVARMLRDEGRCWSETELEAANTLLKGFSLVEDEDLRSDAEGDAVHALLSLGDIPASQ